MRYGRDHFTGEHPQGRVAALASILVSTLAASACGGGRDLVPDASTATLLIAVTPDSVAVRPNESKIFTFRLLTEQATPVSDRIMQFSIAPAPGFDPKGATLSLDRGITDDAGEVAVQVIAGSQTRFLVRASASHATPAEAVVYVTNATHAPAEIVAYLEDEAELGETVTTVRIHLFDDVACKDIRAETLPTMFYPPRTLPPDTPAAYNSLSIDGIHVFLALGLDGVGTTRAEGCVDLPGAALLPQGSVRVPLALRTVRASPEGKFRATSQLQFTQPLRAAATIATAWKDLSDCPLDPARLWLDCTIDALSGPQPGDPDDCRPGPAEGPLGARLLARRGLPGAATGNAKCRDRSDALGLPSHDGLAANLFPSPPAPLQAILPALGKEAAGLFDSVRLASTLTITPGAPPDRFWLDHTLRSVELLLGGASVSVELLEVGAPSPTARFVPIERKRNDLTIASHGLTLRLGSAARYAFQRASLRARGAPTDTVALVSALTGLAKHMDRGVATFGCAALDSLLCTDIGEARGCLLGACRAGLAALAARLDAGFVALDGEDIDLFIGGSVAVIDRDGDRRAELLGSAMSGVGAPGLWQGEVRARGGISNLAAPWTAKRTDE